MRHMVIAVVAGALVLPAAASAKERIGDAKVVYTPAPAGLKVGHTWNVRFRFFFRNGNAWRISGLHPSVAIRNAATGASRVFPVRQNDSTYYSARVVFPTRGRWTVVFRFDPTVAAGTRRLAAVVVS